MSNSLKPFLLMVILLNSIASTLSSSRYAETADDVHTYQGTQTCNSTASNAQSITLSSGAASTVASGLQQSPDTPDKPGQLIYADFEAASNSQPVSSRGGLVTLIGYQKNQGRASLFTNSDQPGPHLPLLLPPGDSLSQRIAFDYEIKAPNEYAGVVLEIRGLPDRNGKQSAEDVSDYQYLMFQANAQGARTLKVELMSKDNGIYLEDGTYPQLTFKTHEGYGTYRIALKLLAQPDYAQKSMTTRAVLKKLTAVHLVLSDVPSKGRMMVDNVVFAR